MEARAVFGSSPFGPDSIEVTATKEEWRNVINDIIDMEPEDVSPATLELFDLLDGLGLV